MLRNAPLSIHQRTASVSVLQAHGWLAAIGWGVLVPSGIVMARR